jgi:hypothetical protein
LSKSCPNEVLKNGKFDSEVISIKLEYREMGCNKSKVHALQHCEKTLEAKLSGDAKNLYLNAGFLREVRHTLQKNQCLR